MDFMRAVLGVGVAVFMMVAPSLGLPYLQQVPIISHGDVAKDGGPQTLARMDVQVGDRVALTTLDNNGNRSALRVLWTEVEGGKLDHSGQGVGQLGKLRFQAAGPGRIALANGTLVLKPGDTVTIDSFQGKWAYAPDGMIGVLRMEGTVLAARVGDAGLQPLGTQEASVPTSWALSGAPSLAGNVSIRAGRTAFVSTEAKVGDDLVKHVRAKDVRVNGEKISSTKWGEGPLDSVSFVSLGEGQLKGEAGEKSLQPNDRVEVTDFIGDYIIFFTGNGEARVALEGWAGKLSTTAATADGPAPASQTIARVLVPSFDATPVSPRSGERVKFWDRSGAQDGVVVRREWTFGDGTTSVEQNPSHAFDKNGVYQVTLTIGDNRLVSASITKNITVLNAPPVAAFDLNPPRPSKLDGVQFVDTSSDPDGRIIAWEWTFGDGASSRSQHPQHQFPGPGKFNVTLAVWDDSGDRVAYSKAIEVRNLLPRASFTFGPVAPTSGEGVQFRDTSSDTDGRIVSWLWTFGDGSTSREPSPVHSFPTKGPKLVKLTVTDDQGGSNTAESNVDVRNTPPIADFRVEPDPPAEGEPARFIDLSSDPDGHVLDRTWSFGDGSISTEPQPSHTYANGGNITVSLTVKDDDGARNTAIKVLHINRRPIGAFTYWPAKPTTQTPVLFNDTSVDPDGRVVAWSWNFGDGNVTAERHPAHQFAKAGVYAVALTVTDDRGALGGFRRVLNISDAAPLPDFAWSPALPSTNDNVTFTDRSTDADGTIVQWTWNFGDGTGLLGNVVTKRFAQGGNFPVALTVTDNDGASSTVVKTLQVNRAPLAAFTFTPSAPSTASDVQFTDASVDADGTLLSWVWDFGDGATSTTRSPAHRFTSAGLYTVRLTVTDNLGARDTATRAVPVGSLAPTAAFDALPNAPKAREAIQFTDRSTDPDGEVRAWAWDFGDGGRSTEKNPTHAYAAMGAYKARLTVTDDAGKISAVERVLRVLSSTDLEVAFRVVYPDGQAVDLTRPGMIVDLVDQATGVHPRPLILDPQGNGRATLRAGEWSLGDPAMVRLRMDSAQVDQSLVRAVPADGNLGTLVLKVPLTGRVVLAPPPGMAQGTTTYPDPSEPVHGEIQVLWKDGTPVRGATVTLRFLWEQLGTFAHPFENPFGRSGPTDDQGKFPFVVPADTGLGGPGLYFPGQHRILAQADVAALEGVATWKAPSVFQEDPLGIRSNLS